MSVEAIGIASISIGGSLLTSYKIDFKKIYEQELELPIFSPPSFLFAIVWPILYTLTSIAITTTTNPWIKGLFFIQLLLNFLWSSIFFDFKRKDFGVVILASLIILNFIIMGTIDCFQWMFMLYIIWLFYAFYLNSFSNFKK